MKRATEIRPGPKRLACLAVALVVLSGCEETLATAEKPDENTSKNELFPQSSGDAQRDVEAPDVFQLTEAGLWDGRPSLGGIWVAHPDVTQPERVIIKNASNNKSVTGALFRRERNLPGPALQVSSAAAEQLGILAGAPTKINVVALRRETVEVAPPEPEVAEVETAPEASTETAAASDVAEVDASEATSGTEKPAKRKWWQKKAPAAAATAGVVGAAAVASDAAEDGAEAAVTSDVAEVDAPEATSETEKPAKRKWWQKKEPAAAATAGTVGAAAVASDAAETDVEATVETPSAAAAAASTAPALTDAPVVAPAEKPAKRKWWQKKDPNAITETTLDPIEGAAAAIDAAEPTPVAATAATTSSLSKPFVQVGTFGVQSNADSAAAKIRRNGMSAEVRELKTEDNTVWRVLVGPAATRAERKAIQNDVKDLGFGDAFTVAN